MPGPDICSPLTATERLPITASYLMHACESRIDRLVPLSARKQISGLNMNNSCNVRPTFLMWQQFEARRLRGDGPVIAFSVISGETARLSRKQPAANESVTVIRGLENRGRDGPGLDKQ